MFLLFGDNRIIVIMVKKSLNIAILNKEGYCKRAFIYCLFIIISVSTFANNKEKIYYNEEFMMLLDSTRNRIVKDYVNALDSIAQAMTIVGGDTESTWAADIVHSMAQQVREGQHSFLENMADIYKMHSYIAYGLSYFNAIIGLPHDSSTLCNFVLKDMLACTDSWHQAIIADDYKNIKTWNVLRFESILNMQLFNTLNGMNNQPTYTDSDLGYSVRCEMIIDSLMNKGQLTNKEIYQVSCFLESSSFFKMIVPLIILFDGSSKLVAKNKNYIIEAALYFDARTNSFFDYYYDGKEIKHLSDNEFEEYMLKATRYKADLLRIATQEILAMKTNRLLNSIIE